MARAKPSGSKVPQPVNYFEVMCPTLCMLVTFEMHFEVVYAMNDSGY